VSKKITTGMRIEAKRIGCKPTELGGGNLADARKIDRAITAAVRKERERCVGIVVKAEANARDGGESEMCDDIIEKINGGKR